MSLDWLDRETVTGAYIWRLERKDGLVLGFTSHDRDIEIGSVRYRAAPGMVPSAIAVSDGLDLDNIEISGVLANAAITETDLIDGRWNGAILYVSLADWQQPDAETMPLICGEFGDIVRSGDRFTVEILGATALLNAPVAPLTSPTCRAEFGDRQCKMSLHRFQREGRIVSVTGNLVRIGDMGGATGDFVMGSLRIIEGRHCGLSYAIIDAQGEDLRIADVPEQPLAPGTGVLLTAGCDKKFATCRDRFENSLNFRGEPYLPGNDLLTRYPGA